MTGAAAGPRAADPWAIHSRNRTGDNSRWYRTWPARAVSSEWPVGGLGRRGFAVHVAQQSRSDADGSAGVLPLRLRADRGAA